MTNNIKGAAEYRRSLTIEQRKLAQDLVLALHMGKLHDALAGCTLVTLNAIRKATESAIEDRLRLLGESEL
jgi:hypothetical protein